MHITSALSNHSVARLMNIYGNLNKGYYAYNEGAYFFIHCELENFAFYYNKLITNCVH